MASTGIELDSYGPAETSSANSAVQDALLPASSNHLDGGEDPFVPVNGTVHRKRRSSARRLFRLWRPLACIFTPIALVGLYSLLHPHVPALPPLPHVTITHGGSSSAPVIPPTSTCRCDAITDRTWTSDEAKRICDTYGKDALDRSRLYDGTGSRVRRVLNEAVDTRRPLKVGILGGSISACHGVHPSTEHPQGDPQGPGCYTTLFKKWLNTAFPLADGQEHEIMNGAIGGMDSSYYAFCGKHHIPADVDIIVLEFDVNDQADSLYQNFFDQLLRVLLQFPSQPAVVILGAWSPLVAQDQGYGDPQIVHLPISYYYDVPYISMKRLVFNHYLRWPKQTAESFWLPDEIHPNARGHRILADLLASYFESQICLVSTIGLPEPLPKEKTLASKEPYSSFVDISFPFDAPKMTDPRKPPPGWESSFDEDSIARIASESRQFVAPLTPYAVPISPLFEPLREVVDPKHPEDPPDASHILGLIQPKAFCADANDKEHPMKPYSAEGWKEYVWGKEKHYWVSDTVGSRISVDIKVAQGRIAVYYFRSQHYDLGDARCWVDDNEKGAVRLPGWWDKTYNVASVAYIDEKVTPGDHYVTCEVTSETSHPTNPQAHHFRIVAIMAT